MEEVRDQRSEAGPNYEATPRGKIGRLPHAVREMVNGMLRDNATAETILETLKTKHGVDGITPQNISNWKANGFQKWLDGQERIEKIRANYDFAQSLAKAEAEDGIDGLTIASDAASRVAISQIMTVLENFDIGALSQTLDEKPAKFIELLHALSSIRQRDQAGVALRMKVKQWQDAADKLKATIDENGVATKEDFDAIYREAYGVKA